ncbi:MAG: TonB-dependent receptor domain-containing protein [bacterium]
MLLVKNRKRVLWSTGIALLLGCMHLSSSVGLAQTTGTITGTVKEKDTTLPLPGTNVVIKGTALGGASGVDGRYTISRVPQGTYTIESSFIGYRKESRRVTVVAGETVTVDFMLTEDVFKTEEVVVTGIVSRSSRAVAEVAVSKIAAHDLTESNTYQSTQQLIRGKVAGVQVKTSSGNVGSGFRFNIRSGGGLNGNEQPVIYVDGTRIENEEIEGFYVGGQGIGLLADLNPEDIENIEILKGPAAAATYGTNGANGVVLITTKRGQADPDKGGMRINYKVVRGWNTPSDEYSTKDYLSAADANDAINTGDIIQNTLSVSGGTANFRYFASFDSRIEDGLFLNNTMDRKNIRANLDIIANDQLTLQVNAGYTYNNITLPQNGNSPNSTLSNTLIRPVSYLRTSRSAVESIKTEALANRFIGSVSATWAPIKGFSGRFSAGIDDSDFRQDQFFPESETFFAPSQNAGFKGVFNRRSTSYTYTADARYTFSPSSDLSISTVVGTQLFDRRFNQISNARFGFPSDLIRNINSGAEQSSELVEESRQTRSAGIFGEANLALLDQYFLSLGLRRDYASVIGRAAPSIFYPKASFAIRLDRYDGFPSFFNLLKLRVAYGESGILPDLLDAERLLLRAEAGGAGVGAVVGSTGDPDIKPERVKEIELGFDAEFLNRISLEFTYYRQKATDSIIEFRQAPSTGLTASAVPFNVGEKTGWGFETLLQASLVRTRNVDLSATLINNFQDNEVDDLGGAQPIFDDFNKNVIKEGLPVHEFYLPRVLGAKFDENGRYIGARLSDGPVALGNPIPNYTGSFALNLTLFKNLNLYLLTDWATGLHVHNQPFFFRNLFGNNERIQELANLLGLAGPGKLGRFIPVRDDIQPLTPGTAEYQAAAEEFVFKDWRFVNTSAFIEEADFFKLREFSISYTFRDLLPKLFGTGKYFRDFTVVFSGSNLITWTKYPGPEPEINRVGGRGLTRGQDWFTLQKPRAYNLAFRFSL